MSLYLTIIPLLNGPEDLTRTSVWAYNRLCFDQDDRTFGQLIDLSFYEKDDVPKKPTIVVHPLPPQLWVDMFTERGIKRTRQDSYGKEITFVYAEQLKKLNVPDDASLVNKTIKAFVDALPDDIPIILEWH